MMQATVKPDMFSRRIVPRNALARTSWINSGIDRKMSSTKVSGAAQIGPT
jgi:hypothetical protein